MLSFRTSVPTFGSNLFATLLFLVSAWAVLVGAELPAEAEETTLAMFTSEEMTDTCYAGGEDGKQLMADSLYRELGRQAVLLTAREEFSLATRDQALLEPVDTQSPHTFQLVVQSHYHKHLLVEVHHQDEVIYKTEIKAPISSIEAYHVLAKKLEPITRGELVEMFQEAGYEPQPNQQIDPEVFTPIDFEVEEQLLTMNHLAQLRALRTLHALIRAEGESLEALSGLVRGYANLAQLTLSTMDVRSSVFAARALLYAERMETRAPGSPIVSWHKAYANTLLGFPTTALAELEEARKRQTQQTAEEPGWTSLIEHYCHYLKEELEAQATEEGSEYRELAALLMFRAAQQSASDTILTEAGNQTLQIIPECLWVSDVMTLEAGVGLGHRMTAFAPYAYTQQLTNYLPTWDDLPESVRDFVEGQEDSTGIYGRAQIANLLLEAAKDDRVEPSLAVLGRNIEAWNVLQVVRRGLFVKNSLGIESDQLIQQMEPVFANHPDAGLIRSLGIRPGAKAEEYRDVLKDYEFKEGNYFSTHQVLNRLPREAAVANMSVRAANYIAYKANPHNEQRWVRDFESAKGKSAVQSAKWMESTSRYAPIRFATFLRHDWENHRAKAEEWIEEYGRHPVIVLAAAEGFRNDQEYEQAIPLFERYLEASPDRKAFAQLADIYYKQEKDDLWLATMERIFEQKDYGLDHSQAAARIAATLMNHGDFQAAHPWAVRAEQSGSGLGMTTLCECLTGLGKFEEAEKLAYEQTMRYGMNYGHDDWYDWCAENQRGQLENAWKLKLQRLAKSSSPDTRDYKIAHSVHELLTGEKEAARDRLVARLKENFSPWDTLTLATLYDEFDQPELRDQALQSLANHDPGDQQIPIYCRLAPIFIELVETGTIDDEKLRAHCEAADRSTARSLEHSANYFVGVFLYNRGQKEEAVERWSGSARFESPCWERTLAWNRLKDSGVDPVHLKGRHFLWQFNRASK